MLLTLFQKTFTIPTFIMRRTFNSTAFKLDIYGLPAQSHAIVFSLAGAGIETTTPTVRAIARPKWRTGMECSAWQSHSNYDNQTITMSFSIHIIHFHVFEWISDWFNR